MALEGRDVEWISSDEIQKKMDEFGSTPFGNTPTEFAHMLEKETQQWEQALGAIGLKRK